MLELLLTPSYTRQTMLNPVIPISPTPGSSIYFSLLNQGKNSLILPQCQSAVVHHRIDRFRPFLTAVHTTPPPTHTPSFSSLTLLPAISQRPDRVMCTTDRILHTLFYPILSARTEHWCSGEVEWLESTPKPQKNLWGQFATDCMLLYVNNIW
jgi:hypothetical protein